MENKRGGDPSCDLMFFKDVLYFRLRRYTRTCCCDLMFFKDVLYWERRNSGASAML